MFKNTIFYSCSVCFNLSNLCKHMSKLLMHSPDLWRWRFTSTCVSEVPGVLWSHFGSGGWQSPGGWWSRRAGQSRRTLRSAHQQLPDEGAPGEQGNVPALCRPPEMLLWLIHILGCLKVNNNVKAELISSVGGTYLLRAQDQAVYLFYAEKKAFFIFLFAGPGQCSANVIK